MSAQTCKPREVFVVDNASTDATAQIARRFGCTVLQAGPERSAQRNRGLAASSGRYVLFLDADMVLDSNVLSECLEVATRTRTPVAVTIPEVSFGDGFWAACRALERQCYHGNDLIEVPRFIEREPLVAIGGYDEQLTGPEDWDLSNRLKNAGWATARVRTTIRHDEGVATLLGYARKKFYYAQSFWSFIRRHRWRALRQSDIVFRSAYARLWRPLFSRPHLVVGLGILRLTELTFACAGFLVGLAGRARRAAA